MENKQLRQETEEIYIDARKIVKTLLRRLPIILLTTAVFTASAFFCAKWMMPMKYTASTYMYVKNNGNSLETNVINQQDLAASKSLVETYIVILKNNVVVKEVGEELVSHYGIERVSQCFSVTDGGVSVSELKEALSFGADGDTEVMVISAETKDPEISAAICDIYADVAPEFLIRIVGAGSVDVIGSAEIPESASSPDMLGISWKVGLIGFILSIGVIVLCCLCDKTVKGEEDFQNFQIPYLGAIPRLNKPTNSKNHQEHKMRMQYTFDETHEILLDQSLPFYFSESYRAIRANLMFSLATREHKIVVITSANASEGKSITAANLAITLAMTESKVLLIDADLRKPVQHLRLSFNNEKGLSEVLSQMTEFEEAVHRDVSLHMNVLGSGSCPPNPSELLSSSAMQKLLKQAEQEYDYIIIDTPPVNVVSDALVLSSYVGGVILVTRYHSTTVDEVKTAMKNIAVTSAFVLGVILNDTELKTIGYGKYGKHIYSSYGYVNPSQIKSATKIDAEEKTAKRLRG